MTTFPHTNDPDLSAAHGVRTRTVRWHDPLATAELGRGLSGRDFLTKWMRGDIPGPPMGELMGFRLVDVAEGEVSFACAPAESVYNPIGMVHGGLACTVLDSAAGCAVHSTLPAGFGYSSIEIKVSFLRPIQAYKGDIVARGWVTKAGKRVGFAEADLRDAHGTVLATASSTCLIVPM